jgi:hypothetical protein
MPVLSYINLTMQVIVLDSGELPGGEFVDGDTKNISTLTK